MPKSSQGGELLASANILNSFVCSNKYRAAILCILKGTSACGMNAESIANRLGISHRTAIYHLDILSDCDLVEVKSFKQRGCKCTRAIWGLKHQNKNLVELCFKKIDSMFPEDEMEALISRNMAHR